jgi:hypothetical protein
VGLDVARWWALMGMVATHTLVAVEDGEVTLAQSIAGGRSSALFATLAGVSMALMSGGREPAPRSALPAVCTRLAVRAVLVALIGLLLAAFDSRILIILSYYGVLFLLGLPFLRLRAPGLLVLAVGWAALAPVLSAAVRPHLATAPVRSPSIQDLADPGQVAEWLLLTGSYPACTWLAYLLLGLTVGRTALDRARTGAVLLVVGVVTAAAASAASRALLALPGARAALDATLPTALDLGGLDLTLAHGLYGTTPTGSRWWLAVAAPHSGTPFDLARTGGSAVAVIGACLLVCRLAPRALSVVFGAGAMTLTLYTLHVLARSPALVDLTASDAAFWTHVMVLSLIGAVFRRADVGGPLEQLVASAARRAGRVPARLRSSGDASREGSG